MPHDAAGPSYNKLCPGHPCPPPISPASPHLSPAPRAEGRAMQLRGAGGCGRASLRRCPRGSRPEGARGQVPAALPRVAQPPPRAGERGPRRPVPLVSKICPSDTYKVWKSGQNLRVDTTLLGFDHMTWQRGNRSFVFRGQDTSAVVMEIDHDRRVVYTETLALAGQDRELLLAAAQPTEEQVLSRLTAPVVTTQLDTKNISFERNKTGILGWRSEKTEMVNGYEAKVYGASNVELITRTRTEHLSEQHKGKVKGCKTPLQSFLGIAEQHGGPQNGTLITQTLSQANPTAITAEEYFNPNFELGNRDMGRPMELTTKTQKFKAKLWLCEEHPLSLCEQVAPIIDLMAVSNALFAKLRDFITLRLPPGFPVKIEIPIFHILNARITFGNLNGCDEPVPSVRGSPSSETPSPGSDSSSVSSSSSTTSCRGCEISPALFEAPRGYSVLGGQREAATRDDDDDLLQFAIQQSLLEAGSEYDQVTIWEALTNSKPGTHPMSYDARRQDRTHCRTVREAFAFPLFTPGGQLSSPRAVLLCPRYKPVRQGPSSSFTPAFQRQVHLAGCPASPAPPPPPPSQGGPTFSLGGQRLESPSPRHSFCDQGGCPKWPPGLGKAWFLHDVLANGGHIWSGGKH
ncbi:ankyrin repeat domain-containing protein 13B [Suricata suricatta]|uniref:ankyrin repeat domain-containing protein 13B n=1 Tax=Suricata suricatta TaxID=37032 RepID=UPI0011556F5B|nr:ankyrin repeat domain-containing protein 13B [Suricata suricatta]